MAQTRKQSGISKYASCPVLTAVCKLLQKSCNCIKGIGSYKKNSPDRMTMRQNQTAALLHSTFLVNQTNFMGKSYICEVTGCLCYISLSIFHTKPKAIHRCEGNFDKQRYYTATDPCDSAGNRLRAAHQLASNQVSNL